MGVSRREEEAQREDTVPDVSASPSLEAASAVRKAATKPLVSGDIVAEKYVVERVLGVGGMAQVLAAKHMKLGTKVAIKVVHPHLAADPQAVARFLREAQAMAQLGSEHTVRVHDVGELAGGVPYIIMEYLDGKDLGALLVERGPLPVPRALE
jgi:serine/threonine protein kinase